MLLFRCVRKLSISSRKEGTRSSSSSSSNQGAIAKTTTDGLQINPVREVRGINVRVLDNLFNLFNRIYLSLYYACDLWTI